MLEPRIHLVLSELKVEVVAPLIGEVVLFAIQVLHAFGQNFLKVVFGKLVLATHLYGSIYKEAEISLKRFQLVVIPHIISVQKYVDRSYLNTRCKFECFVTHSFFDRLS